MKHRPHPLLRLAVLALCLAPSWPLVATESLSFAQLWEQVRGAHPELRVAQAKAAMGRERVTQAKAWEDPTVGLEFMRSGTRDVFTYSDAELSLTQAIPITKQRSLRTASARASELADKQRVLGVENELFIRTTKAFHQLAAARTKRDLVAGFEKLLLQAADITRARAADGAGSSLSVLMAESERQKLKEELLSLNLAIADAEGELNALRLRPVETAVPLLNLEGVAESSTPNLELGDLASLAFARRPELAEAEARIKAAEANTALAKAWIPDPEIMVKARHMNGSGRIVEEYDTGIAMRLPWLNKNKYKSSVREAQQQRLMAEAELDLLRLQTGTELRMAWNALESARQRIRLASEERIPLAEHLLQAAQTGLDSGKSGVLELIEAQRSLLEARNTLVDARVDAARASATLASLSGLTLFSK